MSKRSLPILLALGLFLTACGEVTTADSGNAQPETSGQAGANGQPGTETSALPLSVDQSALDAVVIQVADGTETTLRDLIDGDKPVLLWSWAPWCTTCRAEAPLVDEFARNNKDVQVIGVGSSGNLESSKEFLEATGVEVSFMVLNEDPGLIWAPLGFSGRTENLIISADLQTRTESSGGFDGERIRSILDDL